MNSAITLVLPGEHSYPDPEVAAWVDLEACRALRDHAPSESEYMECQSDVSDAWAECQYWHQRCQTKLGWRDNPDKLEAGPGMEWHEPDPLEDLP